MNTQTDSNRRRVEDIAAALRELRIDELQVEPAGDRVCLRGAVSSYEKKRRAQELAEMAAPGACIENELRVGGTAFAEDGDIEGGVARALAALGPEVAERMSAQVAGGIVHLRGVALDARELRAIERATWNAGGVNRIEIHLSIRADDASEADIGRALSDYVERTLNVRQGAIVVEYVAGVACLSGQVASASQRQAIEDLIRWHDRVLDVVNNLRLADQHPVHVDRSAAVNLGVTHHI